MQNNNISKVNSKDFVRFIFFSMIGIFLFFIPVKLGDEISKIPMVHMIDWIKNILATSLNYIVLALVATIVTTFTLSKFIKSEDSFVKKFHKKDKLFTGILYVLALVFAIMLVANIGPEQILNSDVGGLAISLAGSVLITVTIAGWLVVLLTEFGILEFLGTLLEPIMRVVFKLPGRSAVDALASFVSAPAVGVYVTNKIYTSGQYTDKEACCITTNFSVCSLGFFALLVSIGGIVEYFPHVIVTSLIVVFIMAAIVIRLPPLSKKKDIYFNGRVQTDEERKSESYNKEIFSKALNEATKKASDVDLRILYTSILDAFLFAIKIVAYVLSIAVISLLIATYTPVFTWLGAPMVPILNLLGLPNASIIAPATLVGIAEIALPVVIISGQGVAPISIFFIVVLSTVQIIFFTESANAMLESNMPLNFVEIIVIFLIRTAIAIPLVAAAAHLIF